MSTTLYWWHGAIVDEMRFLAKHGHPTMSILALADNIHYTNGAVRNDTVRHIYELAEAGQLAIDGHDVRLP